MQRIQLQYLYRATKYVILEYQFFYSTLSGKTAFAEANHLSRSTFYSGERALAKLLKKENFYEPTSLVEDPEFTIRLHLFQLYYTLFNDIDDPFPDLDDLVTKLLDCYHQCFDRTLAPTQEVKLSFFLKVWLKRLGNQGNLTEETIKTPVTDETATGFLTQIQDLLRDTYSVSQQELDYVYYFLLSQDLVSPKDDQELAATFPLAKRLTDDFITSLQGGRIIVSRDKLNWTELRESLFSVHMQYTSFYIEPTTFTDPSKTTFFRDLYPAFDVIITRFITNLVQSHLVPVNGNSQVNLYFSYMFSLINSVPPEAVVDRVHIFVDFSQGCLYSSYVKKSLNAFDNANLVLESELSDDVDIYISDFHSKKVTAPQVVWQDPPTPNDWSNLADMILERKHSKLKQLSTTNDS
ncbi:hypothetical protein [Secundilactobacillus paracollinoides]|uniref:hypothetical protein n=1 Tax=Secundilactobacillus paracollinoides TaxID=240427 RepID=UPI000705614F|nr:hypothetical protein [Secundilactobacillus paracollinoides]